MGNYQLYFPWTLVFIKDLFESFFIYHGNGCSDRRCEGDGLSMELLYADKRVLCGQSLNEVTDKYGRWKNAGRRL